MGRRSKCTIFSAKNKAQRPSLVLQRLALCQHFPAASTLIYRDELIWGGELTPSPLSRTYRVEMRYKMNGLPIAKVVSPELETRNGKRPPHLYANGNLCLFYPRTKEWHGGLLLAKTIIPWASEWLFHYEIWLARGEWHGGGYHNECRSKL